MLSLLQARTSMHMEEVTADTAHGAIGVTNSVLPQTNFSLYLE